jgi:hypothetical protein
MLMPPFYWGLVGDSLTFIGGMILAIDAIGRQKEFTKIQNTVAAVTDPLLANVKITKEGIYLTNNEKNVELVFIHRSVNRARWGSLLVAIGFVCLLVARIWEGLSPSHG